MTSRQKTDPEPEPTDEHPGNGPEQEEGSADRPAPSGEVWRINDSPPDEIDEDLDDDLESRSDGDYEGEAWRINENTTE